MRPALLPAARPMLVICSGAARAPAHDRPLAAEVEDIAIGDEQVDPPGSPSVFLWGTVGRREFGPGRGFLRMDRPLAAAVRR